MPTLRGRWTREDRASSIYQYVPVDVPPGAPGLSVRLSYDQSGAVLDLGVFDPQRFRGYSGGARDEFVVTPRVATPGYLPGPLPSGEWSILLGLHRVPSEGVEVSLDIDTGSPWPIDETGASFTLPAPVGRGSGRGLPAAAGRRWIAGDLHAHTVHSDGGLTIDQLADLAVCRGLDFLAVTDHNTTSHHPHLRAASERAGVRLVPGQEVTTDTGHANCFGDVGWVDFRRPSDAWLHHAEAAAGVLSVNHPLDGDCRWRRPLSRPTPLAEVWHSSWDRHTDAPLQWWHAWGGVAVGGSDWHRPGDAEVLGAPTTWVEVDEDGDVVAALRAGRVAISAAPDGPVMVPCEGEIVVDGGAGLSVVDAEGRHRPVSGNRVRLAAGYGPQRLLDDEGCVHALLS